MDKVFGYSRRRWPKLRYRFSPTTRMAMVALTSVIMVAIGGVTAGVLGAKLADEFGLVASLVTLPALGVVAFAVRAGPADSAPHDYWQLYVARTLLVGVTDVRPIAVRLVVAMVLGVPLGWYAVVGVVISAAMSLS